MLFIKLIYDDSDIKVMETFWGMKVKTNLGNVPQQGWEARG